ncbi:MAG: crosslink repair DNA glycosylase YcaQ family protein, partial [Acidimicrobiia bacterium]
LSIHARVEKTGPKVLEDPSLVQLWGPRFSAYVVAESDIAVFTLGRLSDNPGSRRVAQDLADRLRSLLGDESMPYGEAGRRLGEHPNRLRYAAPTGTVLLRWDGARQPTIRSVPPPDMDPHEARLEMVRRYLHVFGPGTPEAFSAWAGVKPPAGSAAFEALRSSLTPVRSPTGQGWILADDEGEMRLTPGANAQTRLLPSGDAYFLLWGEDRELLVPEADHRQLLWTPRVWPGAVLVDGEVVGTWRRAKNRVRIQTWSRLERAAREAVVAEATSLPLPDLHTEIVVDWPD